MHDDIIADIPLFHMVGFTRVSERLNFKPTIADQQRAAAVADLLQVGETGCGRRADLRPSSGFVHASGQRRARWKDARA